MQMRVQITMAKRVSNILYLYTKENGLYKYRQYYRKHEL